MSAPIRSVISRYANRLADDLKSFSLQILPNEDLGTYLRRCKDFSKKLETAIKKIEEKNLEYSHFLSTLGPDVKTVEEKVYEDYIKTDNSYLNVLVDANDHLDELRSKIYQSEVSVGNQRQTTGNLIQTKLPKLTLPVFEGDPLNWNNFWDNFCASVECQQISNVEKFNYLLGCLKGKAKESIEGLAISNANYPEAKQILLKRFGQKELIIRSLYTQLRKIPCCANHTSDLREFFVKVDRICRQLKTQNENMDQTTILIMVKEKLPAPVLIELRRRESNAGTSELQSLLDELERYICIREEAYDVTQNIREERSERKGRQENQGQRGKSSFVTAQVQAVGVVERKLFPCAFCGNSHFNDECSQYKNLKERQNRVASLQLCFKCLRQGHKGKECTYQKRCFFCSKPNHNRALCPQKFGENQSVEMKETKGLTYSPVSTNGNQTPDTKKQSKSTEELKKPQTSETEVKPTKLVANTVVEENSKSVVEEKTWKEEEIIAHLMHDKEESKQVYKKTDKSVLLLTTQARVENPKQAGTLNTEIHIFMDSGSERSFLSERIADQLQLEPILSETLSVYTFGSQKPKQIESRLYEISIKLKDGTEKIIQVNSVPTLTTSLRRKSKGNSVAEKGYEWTKVDMLIGSDYFWEFFKN